MMPKRFAGFTRVVAGSLLLGALLAGCSSFPRVWWPRLPNEGLSVEAVLDYFHKADSLRSATVSKEILRLRQVYRRQPDDETLFQLVALAMQPGRPVSDRQLALQLLNDFRQRKKGGHSLMVLVSILDDQLEEQLQLAGERDRLRQQAQELEATSRELQDKLRALENIEKILRQREM
ncbi:hypothetical protein Pcar_0497 [Syntrophotalea carbinolica DSM 2380]|uniref:Uncharacterized protein n=1 Tax=Syntrophotalea carbinolica (strain DSM 2380 / NBRC 103641 / GraBd1) TaxID=338963 RepID=Q3A787_SYNC1|nr:hypothetical protein [Syntrophotalea carbinolica]ABA87757.1 hypothetical protein Pcar_0497 [Syntrophotalea carbinolica DSM 2380]